MIACYCKCASVCCKLKQLVAFCDNGQKWRAPSQFARNKICIYDPQGGFPNEWAAAGSKYLCTLIDISQRLFSQSKYYELIISINWLD